MAKLSELLSKDNSYILRGLAITSIVLHNFLHNEALGFTHENEMSFVSEYAKSFFPSLLSGHPIGEVFSFLGWVGVSVFVFLTGYGVALKTPPSNRDESWRFTKKGWLKLFVLMLPAILIFAAGDIMQHHIWPGLFKRFSYLTLLVNFAYPFLSVAPGVYWYFGLTFQLYFLWAFCGRCFNDRKLVIWSIICLGILYVLCLLDMPSILSIYAHSFTGWFPVFAIGVLMARKKYLTNVQTSLWLEVLLCIVMCVIGAVMNLWLITWVFVPIVALFVFLVVGCIVLRTHYIAKVFRWIGYLSAFVFVSHPIARFIVNRAILPRLDSLFLVVVIYLALTVVFAALYRPVYHWLLSSLSKKVN